LTGKIEVHYGENRVERLIAKRCELKKLLKTTAPDTALRMKLRRDSMKWLLVCCLVLLALALGIYSSGWATY